MLWEIVREAPHEQGLRSSLLTQRQQFASSQSASDEHGEHREFPLPAKRASLHSGEQELALFGAQPVSQQYNSTKSVMARS